MSADYDLWAEARTAELEAQARVKAQEQRYADAGEELVAALKEAWAFLATMPVEAERKQEHLNVAEQCRDAILKVKM